MDPELAQWIPLVQIATNATLTLVAICIAVASLIVAYRNNFGWKPIAILPYQGTQSKRLTGDFSTHSFRDLFDNTAVLPIELWNRRKYPVVVRYIQVDVKDKVAFEIVPPIPGNKEGWYISSERASMLEHSTTVAPSSHHTFTCQLPFKTTSFDAMRVRFVINISYFDPRKNRVYKITAEHRYRLK
jgi:hypothetical protein